MQNDNWGRQNNNNSREQDRNKPVNYEAQPFVININRAARQNKNFRTEIWTGKFLQVTLMSIPVGGEIGIEIHPSLDQFLRLEEGRGVVKMGKDKSNMNFQRLVDRNSAIMIPADTWHNLINTGNVPIKLYSIYAPPAHPVGTVHRTKTESDAAEERH